MKDLLSRLEQALEGSRDLDRDIHEQLTDPETVAPFPSRWDAIPHYTTSIDAALTLVPEGCAWGCTSACGTSKPVASCGPISGPVHGTKGATPALALCIASLKARE